MPLFHVGSVSFVSFFRGLCMVTCIECPNGWTTYNKSCYWFTRNHNLSFVEAEHYCQQHGGHLVIVETEEENLFIRDFLRGMKTENHWLGLSDEKVEGIWEWYSTNTRPTYTNWYPGEPNDAGNEDCAVFYLFWDYTWADISCDTKNEPICEIESEGSIVVG